MRISWLDISERINYELQQREEEGNDVAELRRVWTEIKNLNLNGEKLLTEAENFYQKIDGVPSKVKNIEFEPTEWNEIVRHCKINPEPVPSFTSEFIEDRILGGWLGRSAGCMLGKPIEKITRSGTIELLSSNKTWPISDYIQREEFQIHFCRNIHGINITERKVSKKTSFACLKMTT